MSTHMKRRQFITLLGGAAAVPVLRPISVHAQQSMPVIGFLSSASPDHYAKRVRAFRQGLAEIGYIEGQNLAIEYRWANDQYDQLPAMAADLIRRKVAAIVANSPAARAAKAATSTIPIVFNMGADPVAAGLVASLSRPGGNVTGVTALSVELAAKKLQLIHELVPAATVIAALINPANTGSAEEQAKELQGAAAVLGLQLQLLHASSAREFDDAFASAARLQARALVVSGDPVFVNQQEQLGAMALRQALPAISEYRAFAAAGGLLSYGTDDADAYRRVGVYTGRILKGEKPADLPVQQATKVELTINLKTAKALGLTVPITLLGRADEVIE